MPVMDLSEAFERVIAYIEADNEGDINDEIASIIEVLTDLSQKEY